MSPNSPEEIETTSETAIAKVWSAGKYVAELDGVRGIAILAVTLYRFCKEIDPAASPFLGILRKLAPMGERGVDLFFVLSGFLITGILLRSKGRPNYFKNFIVRRALRIFPLYFIALITLLYLLPHGTKAPAFEIPPSEQVYLWTYTSNLRMSWLNEWCFGPFDHFWSLAVEEHFYLLWPAIVFALGTKRLMMFGAAWVVLVLGLRTYLALNPSYDVAVDVHTLLRSDALCLGCLVAMGVTLGYTSKRLQQGAWILAFGLFAAVLVVALTGKRYYAIPNTLVPLFFAIAIYLMMSLPQANWMLKLLRQKWLLWLGKYSYGMYVVQLPLVTLFPIAVLFPSAWLSSGVPEIVYLGYVAAMFGMTSLIAWCSYHLIEKHFLKLKSKFH